MSEAALRLEDRSDERARTVASFAAYEEAERAVDHLADHGFPVGKATIVGADLRFVERVQGPWGYAGAAVQGMISGALLGSVLGFLFGLVSVVDPLVSGLVLALWGLLFGAIAGLVVGPATHALLRGRRDFRSVRSLEASRYDVVVDSGFVDQAAACLAKARLTSRR